MQVNIRPLTLADQSALWDMLYYGIHVPEGEALPPRSILNKTTKVMRNNRPQKGPVRVFGSRISRNPLRPRPGCRLF
jgi:hypothetical protein